jgi:hypothetical protein
MPQLQPARALPFGRSQIAHCRKIELGRNASLQEVEEGGDCRGGKPEQSKRVKEGHVSKRSARPNGMSVCT